MIGNLTMRRRPAAPSSLAACETETPHPKRRRIQELSSLESTISWGYYEHPVPFFCAPDVTKRGPPGVQQVRDQDPGAVQTSATTVTSGGAEIEEKLKYELFGRVFINVKGFYEKYFPQPVDERILEELGASKVGNWALWPKKGRNKRSNIPEVKRVRFLMAFQTRLLKVLKRLSLPLPRFCYCDSRDKNTLHVDLEHNRPDIVMIPAAKSGWSNYDFQFVICAGELKPKALGQATVLQIARYARAILRNHAELRFVHCFTLENDYFTPWVFDRSAAYCGEGFNINTEKKKFASVFYGYLRMGLPELGWEPTMRPIFVRGIQQPHLRFLPSPSVIQLILKLPPLYRENAIVCRGTTCFQAEITNKTSLKETPLSRRFGFRPDKCAVKFSWVVHTASDEREIFEAARGAPWVAQLVDSGTLGSTEEDQLPLRLDHDRGRILDITFPAAQPPLPTGFLNRTCRYILTQPCGSRLLVDYETPLELVGALRDVIEGHRFLYQKCGILHRDISPRNILLEAGHGWLIDMDHAVFVEKEQPKLEHKTGTGPYMAVGVLKGQKHSFRHDLESFLYVLVLLSCHRDSPLRRKWNGQDAADAKKAVASDLTKRENVRDVVKGLEQKMAIDPIFHLISKLYQVVFIQNYGYGDETGPPFYGDPENSTGMYDAVIAAFEEAVLRIKLEICGS